MMILSNRLFVKLNHRRFNFPSRSYTKALCFVRLLDLNTKLKRPLSLIGLSLCFWSQYKKAIRKKSIFGVTSIESFAYLQNLYFLEYIFNNSKRSLPSRRSRCGWIFRGKIQEITWVSASSQLQRYSVARFSPYSTIRSLCWLWCSLVEWMCFWSDSIVWGLERSKTNHTITDEKSIFTATGWGNFNWFSRGEECIIYVFTIVPL